MDVLNLFRKNSKAEKFTAELTPTPSAGLKVDDFVKNRKNPTPGNVGVCLSGGGSRALSSAMGQLRALKTLSNGHGDLLSQTKAISTVSGGSWLGVTYAYLTDPAVTDDDYLNTYVDDPGQLVPTKTTGHQLSETLDELPAGNAGENITSNFSVIDIALQAFWLYKFHGTPAHMLWQTVIADNILKPYGLYTPGEAEAPTTYFTFNESTIEQIKSFPYQNATFGDLTGHQLSQDDGRVERPFLICNTAMFVNDARPDLVVSSKGFKFLAPVQCTPFYTGIIGKPGGTDANGKKPGGGGVTSFSFNSELIDIGVGDEKNLVGISENRPFSLLDIVGSSSAAFAETLENIFKTWEADFDQYLKAVEERGDAAEKFLGDHLLDSESDSLKDFISQIKSTKAATKTRREFQKEVTKLGFTHTALKADMKEIGIKNIIPQYYYWPVTDAKPETDIKATRFADGGSLENTGVAAMLSYQDIDNVIAFVNTPTPLEPINDESHILVDETTLEITTNIKVDSQIPPLFGYQPFDSDSGTYQLYQGDSKPSSPEYANSKVFPAKKFAELLTGLWGATGNGEDKPATFKQTMDVVENQWFGVKTRDNINVVWVYTNWVEQWVSQLSDDVKALLPDDFPYYGTLNTELTPTEINLLANLTAWCVADKSHCDVFVDLYQ
ncbi:patatin-like phospholipase family protein [Aliikangiella coralliicola]|uniref:Uncharacterized protein n=1 Tax=Aliikangiella coralliicola TaxID=2592383 RepID=A0A545UEW2_9GAMM|nr:patatin-like phospholipase family protein [Aliikangiella coralliicola]TQV88004.1 hypothetical protein FLL46_09330 [Aliikangiella coralliicola]